MTDATPSNTPNAPSDEPASFMDREGSGGLFAARACGWIIWDFMRLRGRFAERHLVPDRPRLWNLPLRATIFFLPLQITFLALVNLLAGIEGEGKSHTLVLSAMTLLIACGALLVVVKLLGGKGSTRQTVSLLLCTQLFTSVVFAPGYLFMLTPWVQDAMPDSARSQKGSVEKGFGNTLRQQFEDDATMPECQHVVRDLDPAAGFSDITDARVAYRNCKSVALDTCVEETGNTRDACHQTLDPEGFERRQRHQERFKDMNKGKFLAGIIVFYVLLFGVLGFLWFTFARCLATIHRFSRWRAHASLVLAYTLQVVVGLFLYPVLSRAIRPVTELLDKLL